MTPRAPNSGQQGIEVAGELQKTLEAEGLVSLIGLGTDIVFLVDKNGKITHSHFENPDFDAYGLDEFVGKALRDCVTIESVSKIDAMLKPGKKRPARGYQVNHSASGQPDLPVAYTAFSKKGLPFTIVVGREMQQQMQDQQRLVEAQITMEADYRDLRQAEARYRTAFKLAETADIMLDGEKRTVLEANSAAVALLAGSSGNLLNKPVRELFNKQDRDRLGDAIGEARHSGEPVFIDALKSAKGTNLQAKLRAYRESGAANLILTLKSAGDTDPSEHATADNLPGSQAISLDTLPEAAIQTDSDGNLISANALFLDLVQAPTLNQVLGRNASNWIGKSAVDLNVLFARASDERTVRGYSSVLSDNIGGQQPITLSAHFDSKSGTVQLIIVPQAAKPESIGLRSPASKEQAEGFASLVGKVPLKELIRESLDVVEKICIEAALDQTNNNRASAAEMLGLSRQSLYIKLRRHGLENYRPGS
ncbi:transcriptional regulator PpsR [Roseibium sp. HPY-6]|uniref:transcriptional regulator PpsR n=1 Tax=Roseibium sp. HPY-6 TaxID=3229852 RepID=UPI00338E0042